MGQLVSGIAHEINNPLFAILGYSTELLKQINNPDISKDELYQRLWEGLETIGDAAKRCEEITSRLLAYARISSSDKIKIDLQEIVEKSMSFLAPQLKLNNVIVVKNLLCNNPYILGNATELQQVISNIALNAIDAMLNGGKITISTYKTDDRQIGLSIRDTGAGIPRENLDKIFEPFFTTKPKEKSTGLGLAVAHRIIIAHGGSISVESTIDQGTEFKIILPVFEEEKKDGRD